MYKLKLPYLTCLFIITFSRRGLCDEEFKIEAEPDISCRERARLLGTDRSELYELVTANLNDTIQLQCHFCHEIDDQYPKIWYYQDQISNNSIREVSIEMATNTLLSKYLVTSSHTLIIRNVTLNDGGFYFCHGRMGQETQNKYNYLVDVMFKSNTTSHIGNLTSWSVYHKEVLSPMNTRFKLSTESELALLREDLGITLEVITEWGAWGKCQACGHPAGQAEKTRNGFCRVRTKQQIQSEIKNDTIVAYTAQEGLQKTFIINAFKFSCRSVFFNKLFPGIGNYTRNIPEYTQTDVCVGTCVSESGQKGWQSKKSSFKYKKSYVISENAHLTLVCPESTMESEVVWKKDSKELEGGATHNLGNKEEPHIAVDTFSTLYILDATPNEAGNYTCMVDEFKMQEVTVIVVSKSILLTKAFLRHMAYLAFVLSLTLTCYCAGLFVMCRRRKTFEKYKEIPEVTEEQEMYSDSDEPGTPASQINLLDLLTPAPIKLEIDDGVDKTQRKNTLEKTIPGVHSTSASASENVPYYSYLSEIETTPISRTGRAFSANSQTYSLSQHSSDSIFENTPKKLYTADTNHDSENIAGGYKTVLSHIYYEDKLITMDKLDVISSKSTTSRSSSEKELAVVQESSSGGNLLKFEGSQDSDEIEDIAKISSVQTSEEYLSSLASDNCKNISCTEQSREDSAENILSRKSVQYSENPEYAMRILLYQYDNEKNNDSAKKAAHGSKFCKQELFSKSMESTVRSQEKLKSVLQPVTYNVRESSSSIVQQIITYDSTNSIHADVINNIESILELDTTNSSPCDLSRFPKGLKQTSGRTSDISYLQSEKLDHGLNPNAAPKNLNPLKNQTKLCARNYKEETKNSKFSILYTALKNFFFKKDRFTSDQVDVNPRMKLLVSESDNESSEETILSEYRYESVKDEQEETEESSCDTGTTFYEREK